MPKIIKLIRESVAQQRHFYGFEVFPPKTSDGVSNLYERLDRLSHVQPLYCSITWGDAMSTAELSQEIAQSTQNLLGMETMMHITATKTSAKDIVDVLTKAKSAGIVNLCVVRGSKGTAADSELFYAVDLIRLIRKEFGDFFGIAVAGHPEGHAETPGETMEEYMKHLREKIDAGADFVITQFMYDEGVFLRFAHMCKEAGITCPIVPGIMPINTYQQFQRYSTYTTGGMAKISEDLAALRRDDDKVRQYGLELVCRLIKALMRNGVRGFHFYTLNVERNIALILDQLHLVEIRRELPWKRSAIEHRSSKEDVRPIFWSGRSASYLARTREWDEYPNGRWGDSRSAAFGEDDSHHTRLVVQCNVNHDLFAMCSSEGDVVRDVIKALLEGTPLPWSDEVAPETDVILRDVLLPMNARGFITINSQPRQNGTPSSDDVFGWGPTDGFVYQKQYVEFFCSPKNLEVLKSLLPKYPWITFMYTTPDGECTTNSTNVNAVTWGVFRDREIVQPTIVDVESFRAWRPEAYAMWFAPFSDGSPAPLVITDIAAQWYLVNLVDNDYVRGSFDGFMKELLEAVPEVIPDLEQLKTKTKRKVRPKTGTPTTPLAV
eukprot:PhM_4_TR16711/c0_g1_i1/m.7953/K00297/metF, MTHFR; methylenetetrahydrofolate reductase (NADPH)